MNKYRRDKPSEMAEKVAQVLKDLRASESTEDNELYMRYRDMEEERAAEAEKDTKKASEIENNQQLAPDDSVEDLVAAKLEADGNNIDGDDVEAIGDIKLVRKQRRLREKEVEVAIEESRKRREEVESSLGSGGVLAMARKLIEKLLAFKMHTIRAPGDQAGIFDNPGVNPKGREAPRKRYVQHDFSHEVQTIGKPLSEAFFSTKAGSAKAGGNLTPDSIAASLIRGGGGHER